MRASDCMSSPAISVRPDDDVDECVRTLEDHQVRRVPVVDRNDRLTGIVSLGDLATDAKNDRAVQDALERISSPSQPDRT
jgi:CBS-domain-containing membrane protein